MAVALAIDYIYQMTFYVALLAIIDRRRTTKHKSAQLAFGQIQTVSTSNQFELYRQLQSKTQIIVKKYYAQICSFKLLYKWYNRISTIKMFLN